MHGMEREKARGAEGGGGDGWQTEVLTAERVGGLNPARAMCLRGRVAVVTGAAGGIGQWLAAGLGAAGASVVLTDVSEDALAPIQNVLAASKVECRTVEADLGHRDAAVDIADAAVTAFGRIDVLVNCAAINHRSTILDVEWEVAEEVLAVDLYAPYLLTKEVAARMIRQGRGGSIINIGSINVSVGLEGVSIYGLAKAALSQLTKVMTVEWSDYGIRANCIAPGFIMTPLSKALWENGQQRDWIISRVPMRRPGFPSELAGICVLLASDAASFISGQTFYIDGGFLAGSRWLSSPCTRC